MSVNSSAGSSGGGSDGGGGRSNSGSPCGACKFLRRKCVSGCIFAPYFDSEQGASFFAAVHKVFGASNVSKLLLNIPVHRRLDAVITICYEAQSRLRDPVYGCVAHIFSLQQQLLALQTELSCLQGHLATMELPQPPPIPPAQATVAPPIFSIIDLPPTGIVTTATSSMPATFDAFSLFDPSMAQSSWAMQQRAMMDPQQYLAAPLAPDGGGVDLQIVARELMHRYVPPPAPQASCSNASSSSSPSLSSK